MSVLHSNASRYAQVTPDVKNVLPTAEDIAAEKAEAS
jgi:hypothetical protein